MWSDLPNNGKNQYQRYITNLASLSQAFAQKSTSGTAGLVPIVNSKFQETVFNHSFGAKVEDLNNSSFDSSLVVGKTNYLIGIKSFGFTSGVQKIAQFKRDNDWEREVLSIKDMIDNTSKELKAKDPKVDNKTILKEANKRNEATFRIIAKKIAKIRNKRINQSISNSKGFNGPNVNKQYEAVYHVLMPENKNGVPQIHVGETSYDKIDISKLEIIGTTSIKSPKNFDFTDGKHHYHYTDADSQLSMKFDNKNIVQDTWEIKYLDDAFKYFDVLESSATTLANKAAIPESYSWRLDNEDGTVPESSGLNAFDGKSKVSKPRRTNLLTRFKERFVELDKENPYGDYVSVYWPWFEKNINRLFTAKVYNKPLRQTILAVSEVDSEILKIAKSLLLRPENEVYIPLPNSSTFNRNHTDFFGKNKGELRKNKKKQWILAQPKKNREFNVVISPSQSTLTMFLNQQSGKAIQSSESQSKLGEWLRQDMLQVGNRNLVTAETLEDAGINAVRFTNHHQADKAIEMEFFYMDLDDIPADAIGWAGKLLLNQNTGQNG